MRHCCGGGEDTASSGTPSSRRLSSQIKDLVLKFSGLHCRGGTKKEQHSEYIETEETPATDFTSIQPLDVIEEEDEDEDEDDEESKEWTSMVEPGVLITFLPLPGGFNDMKRIRFSKDMFDMREAQRWWGENMENIKELYNVQRFSQQPFLPTRSHEMVGDSKGASSSAAADRNKGKHIASTEDSEDEDEDEDEEDEEEEEDREEEEDEEEEEDREEEEDEEPVPDPTQHIQPPPRHNAGSSTSAAADVTDTEVSEWTEVDEQGVYVRLRETPDGTRAIRSIKFSREIFLELDQAKQWWEDNKKRIHRKYLS